MTTNDTAQVLNIIAGGAASVCTTECGRLQGIKDRLLERLECEAANASATVTVGDESWDFQRFFNAVTKTIAWIDKRCDELEPLGFVQSDGPQCCHGEFDPWPR